MTADVAASTSDRLRNKARPDGTDFQQILVRYACERFLYRLGKSEERERCILKGQLSWVYGWRIPTGLHATLTC